MQNDSLPLVSIGVPLYNEAKHLREALESLLGQSYTHTEMLISDNGSTDETEAICREYMAKDPHISYLRHPANIGQHENFNCLPRRSGGTYFFWASGHDRWEKTFIEDCIRVLEGNPTAVLAYPRTVNMWDDGTITREKVRPFDIQKMSPQRRFREVMWRVDCNYVYGVWRLAPMLQSHLFPRTVAPDRVFLAEMAIKGTFVPVDTIKYYRMNREPGHTELKNRRRTMEYLYPGETFTDRELMNPDYYRGTRRHFFHIVQHAGFPWHTRYSLYLSVWLCGVMKFHLFPGADVFSQIVKKLLPAPILKALLRRME